MGALLLSKGLAPFLVVQTQHDLTMVFFWLGIIFACILIPVSLFMADRRRFRSNETHWRRGTGGKRQFRNPNRRRHRP